MVAIGKKPEFSLKNLVCKLSLCYNESLNILNIYLDNASDNKLHVLNILDQEEAIWNNGTMTNVRETNVRVDKHQSDKRQRRQTSEWQTSEKTNIRVGQTSEKFWICQTLTFCLNFPFQLWLWSDFVSVIMIL